VMMLDRVGRQNALGKGEVESSILSGSTSASFVIVLILISQ
jgi:hypothetical protein